MDSKAKLLARPVEPDTKIFSKSIIKFKEFDALMELWRWEGVTANSVIYLKADAENLEKEELINSLFIQMKMPRDPQHTYKETEEFVFINFNFIVED